MPTVSYRKLTAVSLPKRVAALLFTLLLLVFGVLYALGGAVALREWSAMPHTLVVCIVLIVVSGCVMVMSGLWLIVRLFRDLRPMWIGGAAMAVCGVVLAGGAATKLIPCSGPD